MAYLLDANVFIQAKNLHYGMDFCPAFWDWLLDANQKGKVFSVESVGDELQGIADELSDWAGNLDAGFFLKPEAALLPALAQVSTWATGVNYEPAAVNTFLQAADYYLVSHGLAYGDTVVTHEVASGSKKKIKIPDACISLGVKFMSPFTMLRRERARFVLP
ncbi:MAG: DUF4411 family protein [Longimicrobiales bacterium]